MGLFSFLKKDADIEPRGGRKRASSRQERSRSQDAGLLDPELPMRQRARRRLIGAILLAGSAAALLPWILDSKPKPVEPEIVVQANVAAGTVKPSRAKRPVQPSPAEQAVLQQSLDEGEEVLASVDAGAEAVAKPIAQASQVVATSTGKPVLSAKPAEPVTTKKAGAGKFVILVGAFPTEKSVKAWQAKLKEHKVPSYVDRKAQADGERLLLRAGPFPDRGAAEAAVKKVQAVGLSPTLVEQ